ncbi:hypothetical protein CH63R_01995 [Colletotrichum higginsianum IMI 349063]|uniref:Uncharacterized protein n=1 Tax=Colletotrichum higginsianum (strain IMI 349063) TaxID=759273 RepID=A0A1B7YMM2_COLHI|nr:hypothetical protein CH63R_01995 [Colletotrichum higginsianum IMI 349063]OBR13269.1 hypothetical protein CH63R_01995 [Colletotrichum higginsianum IMI 349063]
MTPVKALPLSSVLGSVLTTSAHPRLENEDFTDTSTTHQSSTPKPTPTPAPEPTPEPAPEPAPEPTPEPAPADGVSVGGMTGGGSGRMQKKGGTKRAQAEAGQSDRCEHDLVSPVHVRLSSYGAASVKRSRLRKAAPPPANGINGDGRASKRASDCPSGRENDTGEGTGGDVPGKYLALPPWERRRLEQPQEVCPQNQPLSANSPPALLSSSSSSVSAPASRRDW